MNIAPFLAPNEAVHRVTEASIFRLKAQSEMMRRHAAAIKWFLDQFCQVKDKFNDFDFCNYSYAWRALTVLCRWKFYI